MTYPEILAAVLGVLGVPLAAGAAFVVWDDHRAPRRPRPPGGRGTWARRRVHWVARCQAQAILTWARCRAWLIVLVARVTTSLRRAWWPGRARHTASLCGHETPAAGAIGWMLKDPSEDPGPSRLATPAERSDAGLDDLPQWERDLLTSPDYLRRAAEAAAAAERHDAGLPGGPS